MCVAPFVSQPCGYDQETSQFVFCDRCFAEVLAVMSCHPTAQWDKTVFITSELLPALGLTGPASRHGNSASGASSLDATIISGPALTTIDTNFADSTTNSPYVLTAGQVLLHVRRFLKQTWEVAKNPSCGFVKAVHCKTGQDTATSNDISTTSATTSTTNGTESVMPSVLETSSKAKPGSAYQFASDVPKNPTGSDVMLWFTRHNLDISTHNPTSAPAQSISLPPRQPFAASRKAGSLGFDSVGLGIRPGMKINNTQRSQGARVENSQAIDFAEATKRRPFEANRRIIRTGRGGIANSDYGTSPNEALAARWQQIGGAMYDGGVSEDMWWATREPPKYPTTPSRQINPFVSDPILSILPTPPHTGGSFVPATQQPSNSHFAFGAYQQPHIPGSDSSTPTGVSMMQGGAVAAVASGCDGGVGDVQSAHGKPRYLPVASTATILNRISSSAGSSRSTGPIHSTSDAVIMSDRRGGSGGGDAGTSFTRQPRVASETDILSQIAAQKHGNQ